MKAIIALCIIAGVSAQYEYNSGYEIGVPQNYYASQQQYNNGQYNNGHLLTQAYPLNITSTTMKVFVVLAAIVAAVAAVPQYPEMSYNAYNMQEPRFEAYNAQPQYESQYQYQPQYQPQPQSEQLSADGYKIVPGVVDARCPRADDPMKPVHLAVNGNCGKFMKCFGGRAYEMDCPAGLEFGSKVNRCDYPALAQCSRF
uniref:Chitin-binding type-2 domain-containing protein n=1 Tax=Anopheles minimus TaxID=112268 RepID=A0A182WD64_9DIPT